MESVRWLVRRAWVVPVGITVWDVLVAVRPVDGRSMQPTLNPESTPGAVPSRNWVLLNRWVAWWGTGVRRGDVVTLISPDNPDVTVVKRVVALEGDIVRCVCVCVCVCLWVCVIADWAPRLWPALIVGTPFQLLTVMVLSETS